MPKGKENVKYDRLRGKDKHKYENEVISHTGNSIINAVADLLIQHLNIQQPQQSENNQELNSLLKETIVNAVNDTINAHINSKENYADEVCRRCKNTIDFAIERETKLVNNVLLPQLSPIIQIDKKVDAINVRLNGIENDIQKIPKDNIGSTNNHRFLCIMLIIITCIFWVLRNFFYKICIKGIMS